MESPGEKLRSTRNEKGLSIDQVSRDTNITTRYLEALENENYGIFPAEPYVIGFLKNYSAYLELDVQKMLSLYKALRIQEQPVPVEQLLKSPSKLPKYIITALIILIVLGAGIWGSNYFLQNRQREQTPGVPVSRVPVEYTMEGSYMERRLYRNDSVLIQADNNIYRLELYNIGEAVTIRTPAGSVILDLSQESNIDLNSDGIPDLRITVADFAKNNADMGALLHFNLTDTAFTYDTAFAVEPNIPITTIPVSTTILPVPNANPLNSAFPFTLQVNFQGYCMFRWETFTENDWRNRNQNYFQRTDELNIQAQNGIRIWISNAQAARFQVIGGGRTVPLEVGGAGEVVVATIRWVIDENGNYRLMLTRLER